MARSPVATSRTFRPDPSLPRTFVFPFDVDAAGSVVVETSPDGATWTAAAASSYTTSTSRKEVEFGTAPTGWVRIRRDTTIARTVDLGDAPYARAQATGAALAKVYRILQELAAARVEGGDPSQNLIGVREQNGNDLVFTRVDGTTVTATITVPAGVLSADELSRIRAVITPGAIPDLTTESVRRLYLGTDGAVASTTPSQVARLDSVAAGALPPQNAAAVRAKAFDRDAPGGGSNQLTNAASDALDAFVAAGGETGYQTISGVAAQIAEQEGRAGVWGRFGLLASFTESGTETRSYARTDDTAFSTGAIVEAGSIHRLRIGGYDPFIVHGDGVRALLPDGSSGPVRNGVPLALTLGGVASGLVVTIGRTNAYEMLVEVGTDGTYAVETGLLTARTGTGMGLSADDRRHLEESVDWAALDGARDRGMRTFEVFNHRTEGKNLDLPGMAVLKDGAVQGTAYDIWDFDFSNAFTIAVVGNKVTIGVVPQSSEHHQVKYTPETDSADQTLQTSLMAPANEQVERDFGAFTGTDVAGKIVSSLVNSKGRITFPEAGYISGIWDLSVMVKGASSPGAWWIESVINLHDSAGNEKEVFSAARAYNGMVSSGNPILSYLAAPIPMWPVSAGDYIETGLIYATSNRDRTTLTYRAGTAAIATDAVNSLTVNFFEDVSLAGGGLNEGAVDLRVDHGIDAQVEAFAKTATSDAAQRTAIAALMDGAATDAEKLSYTEALKDTPDPQSTSSLLPAANLPSVAGVAAGTIEDVGGVLYVLVAHSDEENTLHGHDAAVAGQYTGVSVITGETARGSWTDPAYRGEFMWTSQAGASPFRARFTTFGSRRPANIYGQFEDQRGETQDFHLVPQPARNSVGVLAYESASGDEAVVTTPSGDGFTVRFYTDSARTVNLAVHTVARWEELDRPAEPGLLTRIRQFALKATAGAASRLGLTTLFSAAPESERPSYRTGIATLMAGATTDAERLAYGDLKGQPPIRNAVDSGLEFPANPQIGDEFILLHPDTFINDPTAQMYQAQPTLRQMSFGNGTTGLPDSLVAYAPGSAPGGDASLAGRSFIRYRGARTKTARRFFFYDEGATPRSYTVSGVAHTGQPNLYEVVGLGYAQANNGAHHWNIVYTDNSKQVPDSSFAVGHYSWAGGSTGWEYTPGVAAIWATQGQPEPKTQLAITPLLTGAGIGLTINNSASDVRSSDLRAFSPTFDLDDADKSSGVIQVEAQLDITNPVAATIGFTTETTNPIRRVLMKGWTLASTLKRQAAYLTGAGDAFNGILIGQADVHNGSATLGVLKLWLAHDNNNELGYFVSWEGSSGSALTGFAIALSHMEAVFLHQEGATASPIIELTLRGLKVADTAVLPTTVIANNTQLTSAQCGWKLEGDTAARGARAVTGPAKARGYDLSDGDAFVRWPLTPPSELVDGWWFVAKVNGVEMNRFKLLWGGAPASQAQDTPPGQRVVTSLYFRGPGPTDAPALDVRVSTNARGSSLLFLQGNGVALPAGSTVEVYEAGVFQV